MKLIISMGDCNGIGLETFVKSLLNNDIESDVGNDISFTISGNSKTIDEYINSMGLNATINKSKLYIKSNICEIYENPFYSPINFGKGTKESGKLAAQSIENAVDATLAGSYDALMTLPVSKEALYMAGWKYPGHTEMLAAKSNISNPLMILFKNKFRVALASIHIPLSEVSKYIESNNLSDIIRKFHSSLLLDFAIPAPKIAILGLNPHAGESGAMGNEENEIIIPTIKDLSLLGIDLFGPFPADGFFAHNWMERYDGVIAMYHDQGLIPLKQYSQGSGINFTAGLPFVRTSPAHGTAYDIAGKDKAEWHSTYEAIVAAAHLFENRKKANNLS